jgi:hypothetical protein
MRPSILILFFSLSGCGTFGLQNIRQSESSLEHAKKIFSQYNYKNLLAKMNPRQADVKSIEPVRLYATTNEPFSIVQSGWSYIQSIRLINGNECYAYILVKSETAGTFKHESGSLYCFQDDKSFVKMPL